jgi:hypothetical protein
MKLNKSIEEIKNDYHLFIDIQMGKYLKTVNRSEFNSEDEAKNILSKIIEAYNNFIAPEHDRLDNSPIDAKTAWFNSVEISFSPSIPAAKYEQDTKDTLLTMENVVASYDEMFPFLPKGAVLFLLFASPALEGYGYSIERFKKLLNGEKPTDIEKNILQWAYDVTAILSVAHKEKKASAKDKYYLKSLQIAKLELDADTARRVVAEIYTNIEEHFADLKKDKNKKQKKK